MANQEIGHSHKPCGISKSFRGPMIWLDFTQRTYEFNERHIDNRLKYICYCTDTYAMSYKLKWLELQLPRWAMNPRPKQRGIFHIQVPKKVDKLTMRVPFKVKLPFPPPPSFFHFFRHEESCERKNHKKTMNKYRHGKIKQLILLSEAYGRGHRHVSTADPKRWDQPGWGHPLA